ncbi:MAG: hypothetical protein M3P44_09120, partial [Actinomycetota bacterium]|nr:hypothetical protein [Actinomycetota bacterium]
MRGGPAAGLPDLRRHALLAGVLSAAIAGAVVVQALGLAAAIAAGLEGRGWAGAGNPALIAGAAIALRALLTWVCEVAGRRAG